MEKPTCYVRFDEAGRTIVWMRCPSCGAEMIIHPQPHTPPRPWHELRCGACRRTPAEAGYRDESGSTG